MDGEPGQFNDWSNIPLKFRKPMLLFVNLYDFPDRISLLVFSSVKSSGFPDKGRWGVCTSGIMLRFPDREPSRTALSVNLWQFPDERSLSGLLSDVQVLNL